MSQGHISEISSHERGDFPPPYMGEEFYRQSQQCEIDFFVAPALTMDTLNYIEVIEGECAEAALWRHFGLDE